MFEFLSKLKSSLEKPSIGVLKAELSKNSVFSSLPEQTQSALLDLLGKAPQANLLASLQQLREMTSASRDQVVAKLLHPQDEAGRSSHGTYTVQPGDSLSKIARAHNMSLDAIIAANPQVKNPNLIHPREVINLA